MRSSRRSSPSRPTIGRVRGLIVALVPLLAALLAACGSGAASPGGMTVHDAWIREPIGGTTAGYMVIENGTGQADVLSAISLPGGGMAMLHETTTDPSGMTGMMPVDGIQVPAGGTVTLEPGGFHVMIDGLSAKVGDRVELKLTFEHAGTVTVEAEVRAS